MGAVYDTICARRSIRRFQLKPVLLDSLMRMVNAARLAPSASNLQPCEFVVITEPGLCKAIFPFLRWAGHIEPQGNPAENERPTAYIVVLIDLHKRKKCGEVDAAAATENMLLVACEEGLGTCWIGSCLQKKIKKVLRIPHHMKLESVVAVGYPVENPVVEDMQQSFQYWKDKQHVLHVPKRRMEDICFINGYVYSQNQ
ncbi:MAG TPA: nitroreductase family protein [bacterium]